MQGCGWGGVGRDRAGEGTKQVSVGCPALPLPFLSLRHGGNETL